MTDPSDNRKDKTGMGTCQPGCCLVRRKNPGTQPISNGWRPRGYAGDPLLVLLGFLLDCVVAGFAGTNHAHLSPGGG